MSTMLRPEEIAIIIETNLNTKAQELYDAEIIFDKIVFNGTADFQLYERMQKGEYEVDDYQEFTPFVIERVDHYEYPADYLRYEERYIIRIYGYEAQLVSLETIIKAFVVDENTTNKSIVIAPFRITKETEDVSFGLGLEPLDGSLKKRVSGEGSFSWSFLDGIMTSYDTIIKIDNEEIPYITFEFQDSPGTIQSQAINSTGQTLNIKGVSFYEIQMVIPFISTSTVIKNLYREFYDGTYNKSHVLTYYDTALDQTFTFDVRMTNKQFFDTQPKVLDFACTFVRTYPTVTVEIDTIEVPVLSYSISSNTELSTTTGINKDVSESAYLGNSYSINMELDISDLTNTKTEELLSAVWNQTFETPHTITITKGSLIGTYPVLLNGGSYSFESNPNDKVSLSFIKIDSTV